MKFELESTASRKIKAVYGANGNCIFFRDYTLQSNGTVVKTENNLEFLVLDEDRKPIYEGDTLIITF